MYIEKWKDTAFGSDHGSDFQSLLESIEAHPIRLQDVYVRCDLERLLPHSEHLEGGEGQVSIANPRFEQYVHYEEALIALSAAVIESEASGAVDMRQAYGARRLVFKLAEPELKLLHVALSRVVRESMLFTIFQLMGEAESEETLRDVEEMLTILRSQIEARA